MIRHFILNGLLIFSSMQLIADASSFTKDHNQNVLKQLPFDNKDDFEESMKGFIAPLPTMV
ncbi:hypothetical protein BN1013_01854 [Candidatus Rubidus massiliensis]|nr:hypothetical protein BN1013_01854 [Candidatus Rubidus massiliensis]